MELLEIQKEADSAGRKAIAFGAVALLLAGVVGYLLASLGGEGPQVQDVVVAARDIPAFTTLKPEDLRIIAWPLASIPKGVFATTEGLLTGNQLSISLIYAGEPLLKPRLSSTDKGLGVSQLVEPNMRAFVVSVDDSLAQAQIIQPGSFVDVIVTIDNIQSGNIPSSRVMLQNVQVLAVGDQVQTLSNRPEDKRDRPSQENEEQERRRVVTLLVSPNEVEALALAQKMGKIDLALRGAADAFIVDTNGVDFKRISGVTQQLMDQRSNSVAANDSGEESSSPSTPDPKRSSLNRSYRPAPSRSKPSSGASKGPMIYRAQ